MSCEHRNFCCHAAISRISQKEGGQITHYGAEISIKCTDCGEPFQFIGLPMGHSPYTSMTSFDQLELRAAIKPQNGPFPPDGLPGFTINELPGGEPN